MRYKIWRAHTMCLCSPFLFLFVFQRLLCFELWSVADPVLDPDLKLFTVLNPELNPLWLLTITDPKFSMRIRPLGWKMHKLSHHFTFRNNKLDFININEGSWSEMKCKVGSGSVMIRHVGSGSVMSRQVGSGPKKIVLDLQHYYIVNGIVILLRSWVI